MACSVEPTSQLRTGQADEAGGDVWGLCVDVTDRLAMTAAFAGVAARHDQIDMVFANAGIDAGPGFLTPEDQRNPDGAIETLTIIIGTM